MPPLDSTFFERLAELRVKVPAELRDYAVDLLGHNPFMTLGSSPRPAMEEFFKDLFYDFVSNADDERAHAAYRQLVSAYATVLRRTTNDVAAVGAKGPVYQLVRTAARSASRLSLITFNHDLILENVLASGPALRGRWCLRHGYGAFGAKRRYTLSKDADGFQDPRSCRHKRPVLVHKLHGSLNWYFNLDDPDDDRAALRGERLSGQVIRITRRRTIPQRLRHAGRDVRPVVVPPIYAKQAFLETFMKPVWDEAASDLAVADRVVFFGYSLPGADIEAEKLFQRSLVRNDRLKWIDVVNPDPGAAGRYAVAIPHMPLRWYSSLAGFLRARSVPTDQKPRP